MADGLISRGFFGKHRQEGTADRVPPGQYVTQDFPVLSAGPTPHTPLDQWSFRIEGLVRAPAEWSWRELTSLPVENFDVDIHCVTKWSKLDTHWGGVSVDTLLEAVEVDPRAAYAIAFCDGGYTTNLPLADLVNKQGFVGTQFNHLALAPEHGGPARLVVPHLYFWKSAKWVRGLRLVAEDAPGFWESLGYHNRGDPWKEERYQGD
ncbi:MAG TPA: sulfite oxidase-like oxidoreductase [Anaerolineaceae bacterium]